MMDKRRTAEEEGHRPIQGDFMAGMMEEMMRCCTEIMKPPTATVRGDAPKDSQDADEDPEPQCGCR
ncbi:MAG TPA: hypothetical protein VK837_05190 [Longimicrobiales bacterium]|nr:hypothetical protein [Longimicrobiales bacterium]